MATLEDAWEALFARLAQLRSSWPVPVWTYDRRFKCVTCSLAKPDEGVALAAVSPILPASWTAPTLAESPAEVKALVGSYGGLRAGQRVSWGSNGGDAGADGPSAPAAFALWWPWGDGVTISLRIGLYAVDQPKVRYPRLRDVFGLAQSAIDD